MRQAPLTHRQLKMTQDANLARPDIMMLLREIKRQRDVMLILRALLGRGNNAGTAELVEILDEASELLAREPCIAECEFELRMQRTDETARGRNTTPKGPRYDESFRISK